MTHRVINRFWFTPSNSRVPRGWNNLNGLNHFRTENGSSQGQNLALTGLFVPSSLDSGNECALATDQPFLVHALSKPQKLNYHSSRKQEQIRELAACKCGAETCQGPQVATIFQKSTVEKSTIDFEREVSWEPIDRGQPLSSATRVVHLEGFKIFYPQSRPKVQILVLYF